MTTTTTLDESDAEPKQLDTHLTTLGDLRPDLLNSTHLTCGQATPGRTVRGVSANLSP